MIFQQPEKTVQNFMQIFFGFEYFLEQNNNKFQTQFFFAFWIFFIKEKLHL